MTDALAIAADYEVDTGDLVGVNDYSIGHEAGQMFAAARIADLIRYHEAESPAVALLRQIRTTQPDNPAADEIDELLDRLRDRSETDPAPMGFSRAMLHAKESAGTSIGVKRPGLSWSVFYDHGAVDGSGAGWMRRNGDSGIKPYSPGLDDLVSFDWVEHVAG